MRQTEWAIAVGIYGLFSMVTVLVGISLAQKRWDMRARRSIMLKVFLLDALYTVALLVYRFLLM